MLCGAVLIAGGGWGLLDARTGPDDSTFLKQLHLGARIGGCIAIAAGTVALAVGVVLLVVSLFE